MGWPEPILTERLSRRRRLGRGMLGTLAIAPAPFPVRQLVDLRLPSGSAARSLTSAFPEKGSMILQHVHSPLLETPMKVFDQSVFTPNNRFFVRRHWADIPTAIDVERFRLRVSGHVARSLSIGLAQLLRLPRIELAAVIPSGAARHTPYLLNRRACRRRRNQVERLFRRLKDRRRISTR
jgi:DMSO/TMAO reductase YedYZ molybdopterin-dependent catalytic subunit